MTKGDASSAGTVIWSFLGLYLTKLNVVVAEFMPLITAFGILAGTALTFWYYRQQIKQKQRDRELIHKRIAHEIAMGRPLGQIEVRAQDNGRRADK